MESEGARLQSWVGRLTVALGVGVVPPAAVWIYSYVAHWTSYDGTCGPHAPDISAHPCDFQTYMDQWAAGFGGVGLFMVTVAVVPVGIALAIGCYAWLSRDGRETSDPQ